MTQTLSSFPTSLEVPGDYYTTVCTHLSDNLKVLIPREAHSRNMVLSVAVVTTAVIIVPVRVVLVQGPLGPEHPVAAVLAPELVASIKVLVPRT